MSYQVHAAREPRVVWQAVWNGIKCRCPNCGKGKLFRKYLKVQQHCAACGHDNAQYPADDGPAYFTMLIVGHLGSPAVHSRLNGKVTQDVQST